MSPVKIKGHIGNWLMIMMIRMKQQQGRDLDGLILLSFVHISVVLGGPFMNP